MQLFKEIPANLLAWLQQQKVYFVATAPLSSNGHVNLSPKGYDTLAFLSPNQVAYADLLGSGIETLSHLKENGRITVMFCSFEAGLPRIVRLWGKGRVVEKGEGGYDALKEKMALAALGGDGGALERGVRALIVVDVHEVGTSCGYCVPVMEYKKDRGTYKEKVMVKSDEEIAAYLQAKNATSKDGLPGLGASKRRGFFSWVSPPPAPLVAAAVVGFGAGVLVALGGRRRRR